jgi:ribosomal protein L9
MRNVYAGEVHNVAAGYARNYLIPKKMAVYATPVNFDRCGLVDPLVAEKEGKKLLGEDGGGDLKAADRLKRYLKNKWVGAQHYSDGVYQCVLFD